MALLSQGGSCAENPDVTVALDKMRIEKAVGIILEALEARGQFENH